MMLIAEMMVVVVVMMIMIYIMKTYSCIWNEIIQELLFYDQNIR